MAATSTLTGSTSVEELLRYAAHRFAAAGAEFRPPRMSRLIRGVGIHLAKDAIDAYLVKAIDRCDHSWAGFELFVNGYADPTGAHAARNVDLERNGARAAQPRDAL